jgi:hypothetical protein
VHDSRDLEVLKFLWKQKQRVDRGYQVLSLVNLCLLLTQSETLKGYLGVSSTTLVLVGIPLALGFVWAAGYLLTLPRVQEAEDQALADLSVLRRDIDKILKIVRKD